MMGPDWLDEKRKVLQPQMTKNRTMVCQKPECKRAVAHREEAVRFSSLSVGEDGLAPEI